MAREVGVAEAVGPIAAVEGEPIGLAARPIAGSGGTAGIGFAVGIAGEDSGRQGSVPGLAADRLAEAGLGRLADTAGVMEAGL